MDRGASDATTTVPRREGGSAHGPPATIVAHHPDVPVAAHSPSPEGGGVHPSGTERPDSSTGQLDRTAHRSQSGPARAAKRDPAVSSAQARTRRRHRASSEASSGGCTGCLACPAADRSARYTRRAPPGSATAPTTSEYTPSAAASL